MARRLYDTIDDRLPQGIWDAIRQFGLFLVAYNGYQVARGLAEGREELAFANAERVISAERWLGTFFEPGFQQTMIEHATWLVDIGNFLYMNSHFLVTTGFLVWLYFLRNEHFYFVRNMFMVAMGLALVGYVAFPTAPPRLVEGVGFTDTIAAFTDVEQDSNAVSLLVNPYAAVPSMHVAFSLMIAVPGAALARLQMARIAWSCYPLVVMFAITVTANHFWLDAAAGAAVACMAAVAAGQLGRARPGCWAWQPARELTA